MIKKIAVILSSLILVSAYGFTQECEAATEASVCEAPVFKHQFKYIKLGGGVFTSANGMAGPAVSFGYRLQEADHAIDISANFAGGNRTGLATFPKVVYLQYDNPSAPKSLYFGGGASFGWMKQQNKSFEGLMAEFVLGYDFNRCGNTRIFTELCVTQSVLKISQKNRLQAPIVTLTCGVGF